uniref:Uncharacterized protein MANES_13G023200 n=1 Tax=Rhizophora mucronata TaxID=61149 RepID=A0A2P2PKM4_RHIMU
MSFASSPHHAMHHHHRHPKHRDSWEAMNDHRGSMFSNAHHYANDPPKRHDAAALVCVKVGDQRICQESIDATAEEFIKLEHEKFQCKNLMSFKG